MARYDPYAYIDLGWPIARLAMGLRTLTVSGAVCTAYAISDLNSWPAGLDFIRYQAAR
jgi:hypothetical protein